MNYYDNSNKRQRPRPRPRPPYYDEADYPQRPPFFGQPQVPGMPPYTQPSSPSGPPTGAPPSFIPQQSPSLYMIDPGAIRSCTFQFVYIWLNDGSSFWAWLTFVGRRSVAGWRWFRNRWIYFGTDLDNISSFICY
ncbi:MAG: hypothetical protein GX327_06900 [Epulopiscium sp.]|jgi:hypothetical protein|nr:hypothetical protein [Candidatus Epulonipiscium sp.]